MQIIPERDLREILLSVEKPGAYTGGETGIQIKSGVLKVAISYPDLYEIGMSNLAVKLLYSTLNSIPGVQCERVFAPARDFEKELRIHGIPLYSLESGIPLSEFDIIGFSLGYELCATNMLAMLECGGVPFSQQQRGEEGPLVLGGGPGLANPQPFADFFDCIYFGESDTWLVDSFTRLVQLKKSGGKKKDFISLLESYEAIWSGRKSETGKIKAMAGLWSNFGTADLSYDFPVANIKTAQDHGVVEIMRGCPNGCRFCNAGFIYRPFRAKPLKQICREVFDNVFRRGFREISLLSLSSGDYPQIETLIRMLNRDYSAFGVSFSLPSLRVDTLALELFREIKTVRKSGLTFAVETPVKDCQDRLNKPVSIEKTIALLREAKLQGWKQAKFYFMLGLPGFTDNDDTEEIINCLLDIQRKTNMYLSVNVSAFVPKAHTPFQWCGQITEEQTFSRIAILSRSLPKKNFKFSYHSAFQSFLEGMIGRGDIRVGKLIESAYLKGARFDAWEDQIDRNLWESVLDNAGFDVRKETYSARNIEETLPWDSVSFRVSRVTLKKEYEKSMSGSLSPLCREQCDSACGACTSNIKVRTDVGAEEIQDPGIDTQTAIILKAKEIIQEQGTYQVLFSFEKTGKAAFLSHLNIMTIFERTFLRAGFFPRMTEGFNPKPHLEFAHPLSLGYQSFCEIARITLYNFDITHSFVSECNRELPEGLKIIDAKLLKPYHTGDKKIALMSVYWGSDYKITGKNRELNDKVFSHYDNILIHDITHSPDENISIFIRLKNTNNKSGSLKGILKDLFNDEEFIIHTYVTRLMTFAKGNNEDTYSNYFRLLI
ncbi:MAG: TIGR03960 family B12-binding radical SAM protein [Spirochaetaceae bacterium]|nr:MAG: TIGR03960 family B12-binding radical SAM protein [Spirochaetaceae bacterium]